MATATLQNTIAASRRRRLRQQAAFERQSDLTRFCGALWMAVGSRLAYNLSGVAVLDFYISLIFGSEFLWTHWWQATSFVAIGLVIGMFGSLRLTRRLRAVLNASGPEEASGKIDDDLRREALNLPGKIALVDFVCWQVIGTLFCLYLIAAAPEQHDRVLVHALMSCVFAGELVAIMEFYAIENIFSTRVLPPLMRGVRVSEINGAIAAPTYVRLIVLVATTAIWPISYIYVLDWIGDAHGDILLFVITVSIVNAIGQTFSILRAISRPIGRMAGMFERFQNGVALDDQERVLRADALGRFADMFDDLVLTIGERDFLRTTFSRYMSQQVFDEILNGRVELGGTLQEATVLFADIRRFTTMAEKMSAQEVVEFLNTYLEDMVQAITAHEGIPDKFIGDGILAVWGVPIRIEDHRERAVRAALEMLGRLDRMNVARSAAGKFPIEIGIGIHSGELIAGNIGSKEKMEFTVIGDTVNTCSRIEDMNRELGSTLTISEAVLAGLPADLKQQFAPAAQLPLRGKSEVVHLFTLGPVSPPG